MMYSRLLNMSQEEAESLYRKGILKFVRSERGTFDYLELLQTHENLGRILPWNTISKIVSDILDQNSNRTRIGALKEVQLLYDYVSNGSPDTSSWRRAVKLALNLVMEVIKGATAEELLNDPRNKIVLTG